MISYNIFDSIKFSVKFLLILYYTTRYPVAYVSHILLTGYLKLEADDFFTTCRSLMPMMRANYELNDLQSLS